MRVVPAVRLQQGDVARPFRLRTGARIWDEVVSVETITSVRGPVTNVRVYGVLASDVYPRYHPFEVMDR